MACCAGSIFLTRRSRIRTQCRNRIRAHKMAILAEPRNYSIFDSSINTTSGAPSFVRSLRKGWETTEAHLDRKDSGRKRASSIIRREPQRLHAAEQLIRFGKKCQGPTSQFAENLFGVARSVRALLYCFGK